MDKDEIIIAMAREACSPHQVLNTDLVFLERFAALVAAHEREQEMKAAEKAIYVAIGLEREACAKVCDELKWRSPPLNFAENCAAVIRARGQ